MASLFSTAFPFRGDDELAIPNIGCRGIIVVGHRRYPQSGVELRCNQILGAISP